MNHPANLALLVGLALALSGASTALACSSAANHRALMERARCSADAVALLEVENANYAPNPRSDAKPWTATVIVRRILKGQVKSALHLQRSGDDAACDDGVPLPKRGDKWVIYRKDVTGFELGWPLPAGKDNPSLESLLASCSAPDPVK